MVPRNTPLIIPDEIAKEARLAGVTSVNTQEYSNQEASRLVDEQLKARNSFAIETNLSDNETGNSMGTQQIGYQLHLFYISTDDLTLLNDRINERTRLGDHYVRPDIVEQRYIAGLRLLSHYFAAPDVIELLDNSKELRLFAEIRKGQVLFLDHCFRSGFVENFGAQIPSASKKMTV